MKPTRTFIKASPEPWGSIADGMQNRASELLEDVTEQAGAALMARYNRRVVYELKGAWMAGYAYLDVLQPTDPSLEVLDQWTYVDDDGELGQPQIADAFAIQAAFVPHQGGFDPPAGYMGQRFHLDQLTRDDVRDLDDAVAAQGAEA